jgi:hypothetical protein
MARNEGWPTGFAFGLTICAVVVGGVAGWVLKDQSKLTQQSFALYIGFLFLAGAGIAATIAAVSVWGDRTQPRLAATIVKSASGPVLIITVKDSSLHAGDRLTVLVKPLLQELQQSANGTYSYTTGIALYRATVGPDVGGNVDSAFRVPVIPGEYGALVVSAATQGSESDDCYQPDTEKACVTLRTVGAERPPGSPFAVRDISPWSHRGMPPLLWTPRPASARFVGAAWVYGKNFVRFSGASLMSCVTKAVWMVR